MQSESSANAQYDLAFSVAVVGDPACGKSTLVQQETTSFFSQGTGFAFAERGASEVAIEARAPAVSHASALVSLSSFWPKVQFQLKFITWLESSINSS